MWWSGGGMGWPVGGLMGWNATWPLVRLQIRPNGVRLGPSGRLVKLLSFAFIPTIDIDWPSIQVVQRVWIRGWLPSPSVRFIFEDDRLPVVFWALFPLRICKELEKRGFTVDRTPRRIWQLWL